MSPGDKSLCSSLDLFPWSYLFSWHQPRSHFQPAFSEASLPTAAFYPSAPPALPPRLQPTALCCPHLFELTGTYAGFFCVGNTWAISFGKIVGCAVVQERAVVLAHPRGHVITRFISRTPEKSSFEHSFEMEDILPLLDAQDFRLKTVCFNRKF